MQPTQAISIQPPWAIIYPKTNVAYEEGKFGKLIYIPKQISSTPPHQCISFFRGDFIEIVLKNQQFLL